MMHKRFGSPAVVQMHVPNCFFSHFVQPLLPSALCLPALHCGSPFWRNYLCFPPSQASASQRSKSIKLYVKRVFISDEFDEDLMPRYVWAQGRMDDWAIACRHGCMGTGFS